MMCVHVCMCVYDVHVYVCMMCVYDVYVHVCMCVYDECVCA